MHIQHDPDTRPPAPRPCLLVAGASGAGRGEAAPPRFLDAVDGGREPMADPALRWGWKPAWWMSGVALLAGGGLVLSAGWTEREAPAVAVEVAPQPAAAAADVAAPARGPARIERVEVLPAPRPVVLAVSAPAAVAAQARLESPAAARDPAQSSMPRRQEVAAASAGTPAEVLADPEPPQTQQSLQADADAELLRAVMDWDQRHPPAPGRAAAPAARASGPP